MQNECFASTKQHFLRSQGGLLEASWSHPGGLLGPLGGLLGASRMPLGEGEQVDMQNERFASTKQHFLRSQGGLLEASWSHPGGLLGPLGGLLGASRMPLGEGEQVDMKNERFASTKQHFLRSQESCGYAK